MSEIKHDEELDNHDGDENQRGGEITQKIDITDLDEGERQRKTTAREWIPDMAGPKTEERKALNEPAKPQRQYLDMANYLMSNNPENDVRQRPGRTTDLLEAAVEASLPTSEINGEAARKIAEERAARSGQDPATRPTRQVPKDEIVAEAKRRDSEAELMAKQRPEEDKPTTEFDSGEIAKKAELANQVAEAMVGEPQEEENSMVELFLETPSSAEGDGENEISNTPLPSETTAQFFVRPLEGIGSDLEDDEMDYDAIDASVDRMFAGLGDEERTEVAEDSIIEEISINNTDELEIEIKLEPESELGPTPEPEPEPKSDQDLEIVNGTLQGENALNRDPRFQDFSMLIKNGIPTENGQTAGPLAKSSELEPASGTTELIAAIASGGRPYIPPASAIDVAERIERAEKGEFEGMDSEKATSARAAAARIKEREGMDSEVTRLSRETEEKIRNLEAQKAERLRSTGDMGKNVDQETWQRSKSGIRFLPAVNEEILRDYTFDSDIGDDNEIPPQKEAGADAVVEDRLARLKREAHERIESKKQERARREEATPKPDGYKNIGKEEIFAPRLNRTNLLLPAAAIASIITVTIIGIAGVVVIKNIEEFIKPPELPSEKEKSQGENKKVNTQEIPTEGMTKEQQIESRKYTVEENGQNVYMIAANPEECPKAEDPEITAQKILDLNPELKKNGIHMDIMKSEITLPIDDCPESIK